MGGGTRRADGKRSDPVPKRSREAGDAPITVMIVDDHPIWRQTIRKILEIRGFARVHTEASDGDEAVTLAADARPDVVIMDIDMPGTDGLAATKKIIEAHPDAKVLMLSASSEPVKVGRAVRAGATGYLVKTAKPDEVVDAVRRVNAGELVFPADVAEAVMEEMRRPPAESDEGTAISVILSDGSVLDREGLAGVLRTCGFDVLHQASSARELKVARPDRAPDVAVISLGSADLQQDDLDAILDMRRAWPHAGILVLSHSADGAGAVQLMTGEAQGSGWLLRSKVSHIDQVRDAVARVARGEAVVDPDVVGHLVRDRDRRGPMEDLSERERNVLSMMAQGRSNQAISEQLHMAPKTVEGHVANIFMKLGLEPAADDNRRVLAVLAYLRSL